MQFGPKGQFAAVVEETNLLACTKEKLNHAFMTIERENGKDVQVFQPRLEASEMVLLMSLVRERETKLYVDHVDEFNKLSHGRA